MIQLSLWSISPLLTALVVLGIYRRVARKSRVPGTDAMLALLAAILLWAGCQLLMSLLTELQPKLLLAKLGFAAITLIPVLWFVFAIGHIRRRMRLSRRLLNILAALPLVSIALAMTNDWHQLVWSHMGLMEVNGYIGLAWAPGPWLYLQVAYSYTLVMVSTTILAYGLWDASGASRPALGVVLAPLIVCAASLVDLSPWNPAPWFDFTTLSFAAAAITLDAAVLRAGILDNIRVLRQRVVEQLTEGVVVVSASRRIIDINEAALAILDRTRSQAYRQRIDGILPPTDIVGLICGQQSCSEISMGGRVYDVTGCKLDPSDRASATVLTFRDVTVRRDAELALRNAQQELRRLAHTDPLTGLHNRRLFMSRLEEEVLRVRRHAGCLSVLMLDLDYFKLVNDSHGHDAGDRVLQAVAERTAIVKRATDVVARVGGEEFALLLPETDHAGAMHLAQRLRSAIEAIDTVPALGTQVRITASIGIATVSGGSSDPSLLLKRADEALYRAKHAGRNQVCADA
ncbi:MAG: diguanylate cyclase [Pseudomonadales bacterium]